MTGRARRRMSPWSLWGGARGGRRVAAQGRPTRGLLSLSCDYCYLATQAPAFPPGQHDRVKRVHQLGISRRTIVMSDQAGGRLPLIALGHRRLGALPSAQRHHGEQE